LRSGCQHHNGGEYPGIVYAPPNYDAAEQKLKERRRKMEHVMTETGPVAARAESTTYKTVSGVSLTEATGALAALVLAIVGLIGLDPELLGACAAIAFGVALAVQGVGIAARYREITAVDPETSEKAELVGGMGAEILGGVGGFVLGLLALVGIAPVVLLASASIVFGASLLLGSADVMSLKNYIAHATAGAHRAERLVLESAASAEVLVGIAAITLGILALADLVPMTLILVSFLALGAAGVIAGSSVGGSFLSAVYGH
jgi:hypothetical protein